MENDSGWIKLHRKLLDNPLASRPDWAWLWVVLLLLANHDDEYSFIWNGESKKLSKGQFITGRKKLSEITHIPETTIERILAHLEKTRQIGQQKTTKYRLITILNWKIYQNMDNKRTTNGHIQEHNNIRSNTNTYKKENTFLSGKQINELITLFKSVNPLYNTLYVRSSERKAIDDMAKTITYEKLKLTIEQLPKIISQPYAPKITSPTQLQRDLGKLIAFVKQQKSEDNKNKKIQWT